jgi:hypothetical protein
MGAWKDGIQHLEANSMLNCVEWLLLCNDSNLFLGGSHSNAFQKLFGNELKRADLDLICLSRNFESWMHCGSFFLCFHRNLFKSDQFKLFWRKYLPLSHRHHAIENGEIKLSREVIQNSRISVLYDSLALYREIRSGAYHAGEVFPLLPLGAFYLAKGKSLTRPIDPVRMQCIFATLDTRHPSHVYALLFIKFLRSPFMKKDLFRQGVFCQTQLAQLLESIGIVYEGIQWNECIDALTKDGSNLSYLNYGKVAFRKGVYSEGLGIIQGRGEYLSGLGVSHLI